MSLWRTESLRAYVGESEVAVAHLGGRGRAPVDQVSMSDVSGGWNDVMSEVDRHLATSDVKNATGCVVLGGAFVAGLILPWQDKLRSREERERYARHLYLKTFDDEPAGMTLVLGEGGYGESVPGFFVQTEKLLSLQEVFNARGVRLRTVEPLLIAVLNRFRKRISATDDCVLAVSEADFVHLALFRSGVWSALRSRRLGAVAGDLMRVVQREVSTLPALPKHLYLVEHKPTEAVPDLAGVEVTRLRLVRNAAPGLALMH